ncbi:CPK22 [Symbiodinium microadriaticum]|nr:CPK22 [Symbiodinium microadriaticum]
MRLLAAGLVLPSAALAARVLLSAGDEGIGARRLAFNSASVDRAGPSAEDPAELPPEWRQRLQVSDRLAQGGFGTVYKVKILCGGSHGADLALKVARPSASAKKEAAVLREMHGVSDYCSSTVGKPDFIDYRGSHYILMPYMNYGDFHDLLNRCVHSPSCRCQGRKSKSGVGQHPLCWEALGPPFSEAWVLTLMLQVMKGVRALHRHHWVHMDLKPENVMLHCEGLNCYAQVIDLGLVCKERFHCMLRGTQGYIAPEVWQGSHVGIPANDVFSLGVILYVIETGSLPPFGNDVDGSLTTAYHAEQDPKLLHRPLSQKSLVKLITKMLEPHPRRRIRLDDAESRLREIILSKNSSKEILKMIAKTPEKAGAKPHLPDCIDEADSGARKLAAFGRVVVAFPLFLAVSF